MTLLAIPDKLEERLAEITEPAESAQLARDFKALADIARGALKDRRKANLALLGYAKAARRTGELLAAVPRERGNRNSSAGRTNYQIALADCQLGHDAAHRWQGLAEIPTDRFLDWCERVEAEEIDAALKGLLQASAAELLVQSLDNEWYTPAKYVDAARRVMGEIDLDPASSARANQTVQAASFYDSEDDSLNREWFGRVWLNPPYGGLAEAFVRRLVDEYQAGRVAAAVALVNSHCTDAGWFQPLFGYPLCFTDHRINFEPGNGQKDTGSTHGSVFAYFGDDVAAFIQEFQAFGPIVARLRAKS